MSIRDSGGDGRGGFEAGRGCGPLGIVILAVVLIVMAVIARKIGI